MRNAKPDPFLFDSIFKYYGSFIAGFSKAEMAVV